MQRLFLFFLVLSLASIQSTVGATSEPQLMWNYQTSDPIKSVYTDGNYVIGNSETHMYFWDREGNLRWKILRDDMKATAFSTETKLVYAAGKDLYIFDENGNQLNKIPAVGSESIAVSQDGERILLGGVGNTITYLDKYGTPIWTHVTSGSVKGVDISKNGEYVVTISQNFIYFIGKDGKLLWRYRTIGNEEFVDVSIDGEGANIVASSIDPLIGPKIYLLNQNMEVRWVFRPSDLYQWGGINVEISKNGEYLAFKSLEMLTFINKEKQSLWMLSVKLSPSFSLTPNGDYVAISTFDPPNGGVSYYKTILKQPSITPEPSQTPPPGKGQEMSTEEKNDLEKKKLELQRDALELEKQRIELDAKKLELEKLKKNISESVESTPSSSPTPAKGACGPASILLFSLFPLAFCLRKK